MAPRKSERQATAPTRRSGRIASRASSRASSVADDNDSGLYLPIPSPASLSLAPSSLSPSRVIDAVDSVQSAGKSVISSNTRITRSQSKKGGVTLYNTGVTKNISKKKKKRAAAVPVPSRRAVAPVSTTRRLPFNVDYAVGCILSEIQSNPGSRIKYLDSLTMAEKDAVIQRLGEHVVEFKEKLSDAEIRADQMAAERDAAVEERNRVRMRLKTPMRDAMLQQSLRRRREESVTSIETPSHSHTSAAAAPAQTPAAASDTPFTSKSLDFSTQDLITGTPVPSSADKPTHSPDPYATPKPRSSTSIVGSFFKAIASPFLSRRKSQESSTPPQQTPQEKLGELPASRKRSAPAQQEPDTYTQPQVQSQAQTPISSTPRQQELASERSATYTTPRASTTSSTQQTARAFLMPSSKNPQQETSLATITEHTETSEQSMAVDPTPIRAPRTIAAVRRQQTPSRYSHTPQRIWSQTPQPKDTNADRRLEKLRKFKELDAQLQAMKQDEEVKQMTERPLKRVKVDTLVKIPHNRPGDASGTFRMPDIDSDDEMEVDADQETRSNIFDVSAEEETAATLKATPAAPAPIAPAPAPAVTAAPPSPPAPAAPPAPQFSFPDVGRLEDGATNDVTNAYLGAKFAYGLEHWKATGELLDLF
ncbi:hypothetical protein CKM354_000568500 [Cercospora kikuchii]|uniref:Uncharacterized protein n=1 Tax=Cercospora kikuchii TaxID=84275 RepID=A0A9P3CJA6_9PEZI|nr:uncharacterized protein CKM354_000568500 [Cercospora kikuchii]GIZ42412.1 hypothetical protein CKM354_000568500 [Cercospora kikuchii]